VKLEGGNLGGAALVQGTVRRQTGPWTAGVHALLRHLEAVGFARAPRVRGVDEQGREILTFLPGETVGNTRPWPAWAHADISIDGVASWLRDFHDAVADFVPEPGTTWRGGVTWQPGMIVGHNDAAPYNAAWSQRGLEGFFDWDWAGPGPVVTDLAFTVFAWAPLHVPSVLLGVGFSDLDGRRRRLERFLDVYGWQGTGNDVLDAVRARLQDHIADVQRLAAAGDPHFVRLLEEPGVLALPEAIERLDDFRL
jgi:hypothetical protein